jgi:hypothetical protein
VSREAAPRELEVEAAGLIRAALTGDEFTIDRIVTRSYETDLDWRSFANEVTYTAACLLLVASGSKAQATALVDTWLDSLVRKRMAVASLPFRRRRYGSSRAWPRAETFTTPFRRRREPRRLGWRALRARLRLAG